MVETESQISNTSMGTQTRLVRRSTRSIKRTAKMANSHYATSFSSRNRVEVEQENDSLQLVEVDKDSAREFDPDLEEMLTGHGDEKPEDVVADLDVYSDSEIEDNLDDLEWPVKKKERLFWCELCPSTLATMYTLRNHELITHDIRRTGRREFVCKGCMRGFDREHHLRLHVKITHNSDNPDKLTAQFVCEICGKNMHKIGHYNIHMKAHKKEKIGTNAQDKEPQICEYCGKVFRWQKTLKAHMNSLHFGIKRPKRDWSIQPRKFSCDKCGKAFKRQQHLDDHVGTRHQTADLKYKCDRCPATFIRPHLLEYHNNKFHLRQKPHKCTKCMEGFYSAVATKKHFKLCSMPQSQKLPCEFCGQLFTTIRNLEMHKEARHKDNLLTCACGVVVKWRSSMAKHRRKCVLNKAMNVEVELMEVKGDNVPETAKHVDNGTNAIDNRDIGTENTSDQDSMHNNTDHFNTSLDKATGFERSVEVVENVVAEETIVSSITEERQDGGNSVFYVILKE